MKILIVIFALLYSCSNNPFSDKLGGTWNVNYAYYYDELISHDTTRRFYSNATMYFDIAYGECTLPLDRIENRELKIGKFEIHDSILIIYNAQDERFNGTYETDILEVDTSFNMQPTRYYYITLTSENMLIRAERFK